MGVDAEMFARVKRAVPEAEVADLAYRIAATFGQDQFIIFRPGEWGYVNGQRAIERVEVYEQDGPDITPEPGETFLRVHLLGRYYGKGYERGHLPTYVCVAMWLEQNIPGCSVWYGGDSSGICASAFGHAEREALMRHYCDVGHEPYESHFDRGGEIVNPMCSLCRRPAHRYGYGNSYAAYRCLGCGWDVVTRDGGKTLVSRAEDDAAEKDRRAANKSKASEE